MTVRVELDPHGATYEGRPLWVWVIERDGQEVTRAQKPQLQGVALASGRNHLSWLISNGFSV